MQQYSKATPRSRAGITLLLLCATCAAQTPLTITAVENSADLRPGFSQRGSLTSVFLTGLQGEGTVVNTRNPLPYEVQGTTVWVNFVQAPIVSISFQPNAQQINIQVPWEGDRDPLYLEVFQNGNRAAFQGLYTNYGTGLITQNWSVFFVDASGRALVQHAADYSPVTPQKPAVAGENLIAYGINLGPVTNQPNTGYAAPSNPLAPSDWESNYTGLLVCASGEGLLIGTSGSAPTYDGLSPGLVGVYQINFQLPAGLPPGDTSLTIQRSITQVYGPSCQPPYISKTTTTATSFSALLAVQ